MIFSWFVVVKHCKLHNKIITLHELGERYVAVELRTMHFKLFVTIRYDPWQYSIAISSWSTVLGWSALAELPAMVRECGIINLLLTEAIHILCQKSYKECEWHKRAWIMNISHLFLSWRDVLPTIFLVLRKKETCVFVFSINKKFYWSTLFCRNSNSNNV